MFTALATQIYKGPATVQFINSIKQNLDALFTGVAKSWVNFNGATGTPFVRASDNVASITDIAVGRYGINHDVDFSTGAYVTVGMAWDAAGQAINVQGDRAQTTATDFQTSAVVRVETNDSSFVLNDADVVMVANIGAR